MTDPIVAAASFLAEHAEWMRHRPEAGEFLADVDTCHRTVLGIARGPGDRRYLGPCGAEIAWAPGTMVATEICDGEVYARRGGETGHCQACGAAYDVRERTDWLDGSAP